MFDAWFRKELDAIKATADATLHDQIEHAGQVGKMLIDYLMLQLKGVSVSINTQPVTRAEPV